MTRRAIYRGRVQGVGFRRRTQRLATNHPVAGYVRNLDDGSVELEIEGDPAAVTQFLAAVAHEMIHEIDTVEYSDHPPRGYQGFEIKRS